MSCFGCFSSNEKKVVREANPRRAPRSVSSSSSKQSSSRRTQENNNNATVDKTPSSKDGGNNESGKKQVKVGAQIFSFEELALATKNFHKGCLIGEGGFGRVYKGVIGKIGKVAAIKQLDRSGLQGNREFLIEAMMLSLLHHEHLVNLIGYCTDGDQRLLVYEHMALGSLEDHLFDLPPFKKPLDWSTRMKIALGAAKGLEYLHYKANPPVIYRDLKSANILLDKEFKAKLSDFGLAKLGPQGDKTHVSSRVMGTYGYCAPEYLRTGQLTVKSDVYSFGVVMLEIITGRMAFDNMRPKAEQNVVNWADPMFKDQSRYRELADPLMKNNYPMKGLNQAVAVAAMCLHEDASSRPFMSDVVNTLSFLGEKAINVEEEEEEEEDVITSPSHNITTEETKVVRKNNNGSGHR